MSQPPVWDSWRRELRLGEQLVRRFAGRAENQLLIVEAFEASGWIEVIQVPLSLRAKGLDASHLRRTIQRMNEQLDLPLLHFEISEDLGRISWHMIPTPRQQPVSPVLGAGQRIAIMKSSPSLTGT